MVNIAVIVSLFLATRLQWEYADPVFAIGIVGYMGFGSVEIFKDSLDSLMDREFSLDARKKISDIREKDLKNVMADTEMRSLERCMGTAG